MERLLERIYTAASERTIATMLDLDGATLHRPPGVHSPVEPDLAYDGWLQTLANNGCPAGINTGRPMMFIQNVFPGFSKMESPFVFKATETGARIIQNNDETFRKGVPDIGALRAKFSDVVKPYTGAIVEAHKACAITLSYKGTPMDARKAAYDHGVSVATQLAEGNKQINVISVWKGEADAYIEIVPAGINKGTAAHHMMDQDAYTGKTTITFGDSKADEAMMAVVRNRGGISIGVGNSISAELVDINLQTIDQARQILENVAGLVEKRLTVEDAMAFHGYSRRLAM